jgi:acyl-coenzyme A thioesterase PaaI-like protein
MACGSGGLGLHFDAQPDGSVEGVFDCASAYQGYQDRLHGGVVATLADAAMVV